MGGGDGRGRDFPTDGVRRELESFDEVSDTFDWSFDEESRSSSWKFDGDERERMVEKAGKSLLFTSHED